MDRKRFFKALLTGGVIVAVAPMALVSAKIDDSQKQYPTGRRLPPMDWTGLTSDDHLAALYRKYQGQNFTEFLSNFPQA